MQDRCKCKDQVRLGDRAAQTMMSAESEGQVDAGLLVFGTLWKESVNVEAIRFREKFRAVMRYGGGQEKPNSRRYRVASELKGIHHVPED